MYEIIKKITADMDDFTCDAYLVDVDGIEDVALDESGVKALAKFNEDCIAEYGDGFDHVDFDEDARTVTLWAEYVGDGETDNAVIVDGVELWFVGSFLGYCWDYSDGEAM